MPIDIKTFFEKQSSTFTHVVSDVSSGKAAIIDSVLGYDQYSGRINTQSADEIATYIKDHDLSVQWLLDTHIHADHITAAHYLKTQLGGKIGIGSKIKEVLDLWVPIFNTFNDTALDGSQFDSLFEDGEVFKLGTIEVKVIHTPGHTPACSSYLIENNVFVGDTLFMPDLGTARTDFPGGSANTLYASVQKIFSLPANTAIFMCHDYPPQARNLSWTSSIIEQTQKNVLVKNGISKKTYVKMRHELDKNKMVPKLLLPAVQANLRAGTFGFTESCGIKYIKIPINKI